MTFFMVITKNSLKFQSHLYHRKQQFEISIFVVAVTKTSIFRKPATENSSPKIVGVIHFFFKFTNIYLAYYNHKIDCMSERSYSLKN